MAASAKPIAGVVAACWLGPEWLAGSSKAWPNAIPAGLCAALLACGLWLLWSSRGAEGWLPIWCSGLWIAGAGAFADRALDVAGVHMFASSPLLVAALLAGLPIVNAELRARPAFGARLAFAISWPWASLIIGPPWIYPIGIVGTGALFTVAVETIARYQPRGLANA